MTLLIWSETSDNFGTAQIRLALLLGVDETHKWTIVSNIVCLFFFSLRLALNNQTTLVFGNLVFQVGRRPKRKRCH